MSRCLETELPAGGVAAEPTSSRRAALRLFSSIGEQVMRGSRAVGMVGIQIGFGCSLFACLVMLVHAQAPKARDQEELLRLLGGDDPRLVQQAAEEFQKALPKSREALEAATEGVKSALGTTRDAKAERALRLALGKLAAAGVEDTPDWALDTVEWGFESMSVTHRPTTPPEVFEAHVRALEMVPGAARELMLGNLDVAINFPDVEPMERERLKEFVTLTAAGMGA